MADTIFKDKTLLITGGTGSFGNTVLNRFLTTDIGEIRIFSRDEKKQDDMRHELQAKYPGVRGEGQVLHRRCARPAVSSAMPCPASTTFSTLLRSNRCPPASSSPWRPCAPTLIGTDNVLHAAIEAGVERVICLSTDKAAYPINAMGISKAMMEHVIIANARVSAQRGGPVICCTRYGNVMCSRGSVIPLFDRADQVRQPYHHHRPQHDPLPDEPGRSRGSGYVRL